nr:LysR family transcriptional regulator [Pectobacterium brasiliense]
MEIVRSGSFEVAARKLHVTPSAISQRIKQLEDHIAHRLFTRRTLRMASMRTVCKKRRS